MSDDKKPRGFRGRAKGSASDVTGGASKLPDAGERRSKIHLSGNPPARPNARVPLTPSVDNAPTPRVRDNVPPIKAPVSKQPTQSKQLNTSSLYSKTVERSDPLTHSPLAVVEEWTDDTSTDTTLGLGAEGIRDSERGLNTKTGAISKKRVRRFTLNERDVSILRLLGKYRFGYRTQIEKYVERKDMSRRMTQLANAGYVRNEIVTQTQALWTPTGVGLDVAGLDVPVLTHGKIAPSTIGHTVGLLNLGIDLEHGHKETNPLKDDSWPYRYRREMNPDGSFRLEMGESIITERMIVQSWNRQKVLYTEAEMREQLQVALQWKPKSPGIGSFGPETQEGNEWMFIIMSPSKTHTPDMVLARPRNPDGSCAHVAIELELNNKSMVDWTRILTAYKGSPVYKTVAYFTHKRGIANSLTALNKQKIGMVPGEQFIMLKYVPANRNLPFWG